MAQQDRRSTENADSGFKVTIDKIEVSFPFLGKIDIAGLKVAASTKYKSTRKKSAPAKQPFEVVSEAVSRNRWLPLFLILVYIVVFLLMLLAKHTDGNPARLEFFRASLLHLCLGLEHFGGRERVMLVVLNLGAMFGTLLV